MLTFKHEKRINSNVGNFFGKSTRGEHNKLGKFPVKDARHH